MEIAYFGAGCFWNVEEEFDKLHGVEASVGYMGGNIPNPTYKQVCSNSTGHVEVVKLVYDPKKIKYEKLLELFWKLHDPTQFNRQGPDIGIQYKSIIFYTSEKQKKTAEKSVKVEQKNHKKEIKTQILKAPKFWRAEDYHQKYYKKHKTTAFAMNTINKIFRKI